MPPLKNPNMDWQQNVQVPQTPPVRDLQFGSNTPVPPPQGGPVTDFNTALQGLLQKYQQLGTKPFKEQELNAKKAQNDRILAQTPQSLIGGSADIQNSVRTASANALNPTIQGAQNSQQTYSEQLRSFGDAVTTARQFMADTQASSDRARDDARAVIKDALTLGGADSLKGLTPEEVTKLERAAGYPSGYVHGLAQTIKERELELKRQADADRAAQRASPSATELAQKEKENAKAELLDLLGQYRAELQDSSFTTRMFNPTKATALNNLKGQITAVYKKSQQLGTLDAGVQKLIDTIIPGTEFGLSQGSTEGQLAALDNFITNQGGTVPNSNGPVIVDGFSFPSQAQAEAYKAASQGGAKGINWPSLKLN